MAKPERRQRRLARVGVLAALTAGALGSALIAADTVALPGDGSRYESSAAGVEIPAWFLRSEHSVILAPRFLQDPRFDDRPEFIWPVEHGWITTLFSAEHTGVDVGFEDSPPVRAARDGVVAFIGGDPCCSKGLFVVIWHDDGWSTLYGHLNEFSVEPGDVVKQGDTIGIGGSTGNSTGPHVHLELLQDGYAVDPMGYFPPDIEIRLEPDATETPTETGTPGTPGTPDAELIETPTPPNGHEPTETPSTAPAPTSETPSPPPPPAPTATPIPTVAAAPP